MSDEDTILRRIGGTSVLGAPAQPPQSVIANS
jgi:hypothetical protein